MHVAWEISNLTLKFGQNRKNSGRIGRIRAESEISHILARDNLERSRPSFSEIYRKFPGADCARMFPIIPENHNRLINRLINFFVERWKKKRLPPFDFDHVLRSFYFFVLYNLSMVGENEYSRQRNWSGLEWRLF